MTIFPVQKKGVFYCRRIPVTWLQRINAWVRTVGFGLQEVGLDSAGCLSTCRMLSNKQLHDLKKGLTIEDVV